MKYQITCRVQTVNANVFVQQPTEIDTVVIDVPSDLIERMTREIIPKAKRVLGKNRVIIGLSSIQL
jgi:hypothetical protein